MGKRPKRAHGWAWIPCAWPCVNAVVLGSPRDSLIWGGFGWWCLITNVTYIQVPLLHQRWLDCVRLLLGEALTPVISVQRSTECASTASASYSRVWVYVLRVHCAYGGGRRGDGETERWVSKREFINIISFLFYCEQKKNEKQIPSYKIY